MRDLVVSPVGGVRRDEVSYRAPAMQSVSRTPLDLVRLAALMQRTSGRPDVVVGLIDGPVAAHLPVFDEAKIEAARGVPAESCTDARSIACSHGTFIAGLLVAKRGSPAPAICPACTLIVRPIFSEKTNSSSSGALPSATAGELAAAIVACMDTGARVLNLSLALLQASPRQERELVLALDWAAQRGVLVVAAAGNQSMIGSTALTRHRWVIPVAACDTSGRVATLSNLGNSIGRQGLCAPGERISSVGSNGQLLTMDGTSVAAPFVTGVLALLLSEFPRASAAQIRLAVSRPHTERRPGIAPPLLDAWGAYEFLQQSRS